MKSLVLVLLLLSFCLPTPLPAQEKGVTPVGATARVAPAGTTRAVVIGISDYQDKDIPDLKYAHKDAEAFANFLRSPAGGALDGDHLKVLTNADATAGRIAEAFDGLVEQTKEGGHVIIYFSGHGDVERKIFSQPGFLLCWDAPSRVYMGGGTYSLSFLEAVVTTLSVQNRAKVTVITDACHAGKLAGSQIGGAQLTSVNLARQYANEVKILSCQPNEFSLEGEQWGGGRGVFSYHLMDGLFGLADRNGDGTVTVGEIDRYLEDKVTAEVAPQSQVPMLLGSKTEPLATVDAAILAALKKNKEGGLPVFAATESRGFEEEVLAKLDSGIVQKYLAFKKAVAEKRFFPVANVGEVQNLADVRTATADELYTQLSENKQIAPLHGSMKRNYAAALQDDAQAVINQLLRTDPQIVDNAFSPVSKYDHLPRYLHRAGELLGERHYMYRFIKAREYYFRAKTCRPENYPELTPDSLLNLALVRLDTALLYDEEAAYAWFEKGYLLFWNVFNEGQSKEALSYFEKASILSAEWLMARYYVGRTLTTIESEVEKGVAILQQVVAQDSLFLPVYRELGIITQDDIWFETYVLKFQEYEQVHPGNLPAIYYNYLGSCLLGLQRNSEAVQALLQGAQLSNDQLPQIYINLGRAYRALESYEDAEKAYLKGIELSPLVWVWKMEVASLLILHSNSPVDSIKPCFVQGVQLNPALDYGWYVLSCFFLKNGQLDSAENTLQQWLLHSPQNNEPYLLLAHIQNLRGKDKEARQALQKVLIDCGEDLTSDCAYNKLIAFKALGLTDSFDVMHGKMQPLYQRAADYYAYLALIHAFSDQQTDALVYFEKSFQQEGKLSDPVLQDVLIHPATYRLQQTPEFKALVKGYFPDKIKD